MRRAFILASLLAVFSAGARADTNFHVADIAEVRHDDDPDDPKKPVTDVVVLSEGYTSDNEALFWQKAQQIARSLRDDQATSVMREVTTFHFTYVWVPSKDKGAPWRTGQKAGDTPFGAYTDEDGSLSTDDNAVDRAVKHVVDGTHKTVSVVMIHLLSKYQDPASAAPKGIKDANTGPDDVRDISDTPEDLYGKLVRSDRVREGKNAHQVGRVRQVDLDMRAFVHEFGHARFGLDDEYSNDPDEALPDSEKGAVAQFPNDTTDPSGSRWKSLVPDLYDASGKIKQIFEGGSGYGKGVWRAYKNCRMNQSRSQDFCPVCKAIIRASIHDGEPLPAPVWVQPASANGKVSVSVAGDGTRTVALQWKPGSSEQPNSWHVQLTDATGKVTWDTYLEGDVQSFDMPAPKPGPYTLSVTGERVALADPSNVSPPATQPLFLDRPAPLVAKSTPTDDQDDATKAKPVVPIDRGFSRTPGLSGRLTVRVDESTDDTKDEDER